MKKNIFFLLLNLAVLGGLLLNLASCNTTEPPPPPENKPTLTLALDDTSCTEAWLRLTTKDLTLPAELTLKQYNQTGDSLSQYFILSTQDSILYIDSLLPNQNYFFQVSSIQQQASSIKQQVTTMDTTSHNFTNWQSFTWGNVGSSHLTDVAIINENDIWAVGEIKIADSSLIGYATYNAVHWNGISWELKKIKYYSPPCSIIEYPEIRAIWAFSENNIVLTDGGSIGWFDGSNVMVDCEVNPLLIGAIKKMWGTSNSDLYAVGYSGNIIHFNGTSWKRIESGTTLNINDIWGDYNQKTQEWEILAVASDEYNSLDKEVLKISQNSVHVINKIGIEEPLRSIWFKANKKYYAVGSGTYEKTHLNDPEWKGDPLDITQYFENRIRANNINDVIIVGAYGEVLHFNGYTWHSYLPETYIPGGFLWSVALNNNLLVAVGGISSQALIKIGRK